MAILGQDHTEAFFRYGLEHINGAVDGPRGRSRDQRWSPGPSTFLSGARKLKST